MFVSGVGIDVVKTNLDKLSVACIYGHERRMKCLISA